MFYYRKVRNIKKKIIFIVIIIFLVYLLILYSKLICTKAIIFNKLANPFLKKLYYNGKGRYTLMTIFSFRHDSLDVGDPISQEVDNHDSYGVGDPISQEVGNHDSYGVGDHDFKHVGGHYPSDVGDQDYQGIGDHVSPNILLSFNYLRIVMLSWEVSGVVFSMVYKSEVSSF